MTLEVPLIDIRDHRRDVILQYRGASQTVRNLRKFLEENVSPAVITQIKNMLPKDMPYGQQPLAAFAAIKVFVPAKLMTDEFLKGRPISSPFVLERGTWRVAPEWQMLMRSAQDAVTSKGALFVSENKIQKDLVVTITQEAVGVPSTFNVILNHDSDQGPVRFTVPVEAIIAPALRRHYFSVRRFDNIFKIVDDAVYEFKWAQLGEDRPGVDEVAKHIIGPAINKIRADEVFDECASELLMYLSKMQAETNDATFELASENMRRFLFNAGLLEENEDGTYSSTSKYALYKSRFPKRTARPKSRRDERRRGAAPYTITRGSFADACV